jgi:hypothetical protein
MAAEIAWIQLFIRGNDNSVVKRGQAFRVNIAGLSYIDDLKKAVVKEMDKSLGHCNAANLVVYTAGTEIPTDEEVPLNY